MALEPSQTTLEFSLRTVLLFLTWHREDFTDQWLKEELEAKHGKTFNATNFLRANPSRESLSDLYEPIKEIVAERIDSFEQPVKWSEHVRPHVELVFGSADDDKRPFHLSEWGIRNTLNLRRTDLDRATDAVGGFWYVIRPDSEIEYSELIAELDAIVLDERKLAQSGILFNCGILTVSPVEFSPGELPTFQYEAFYNKNRNMKFHGYVYPLNTELVFQGAMNRQYNHRIGQFTWPFDDGEEATGNNGLMMARNKSGDSIATMATFVRATPTAEEMSQIAGKDLSMSEIHSQLHEPMSNRLKARIKKMKLKKLVQHGILDHHSVGHMLELYRERVVYST